MSQRAYCHHCGISYDKGKGCPGCGMGKRSLGKPEKTTQGKELVPTRTTMKVVEVTTVETGQKQLSLFKDRL